MKLKCKALIVAFSLPFFILSSVTTADANLGARAYNAAAMSFGTGTFKVAPETTTAGTATGIQTFSAIRSNVDVYFYYVNTGNITVSAFTFTMAKTGGSGTYNLWKCPVNTTFSTATLCSDSSAPVSITLTGTGSSLSAGQWLPIYINVLSRSDTFTAASSVSSSQLRAAVHSVS